MSSKSRPALAKEPVKSIIVEEEPPAKELDAVEVAKPDEAEAALAEEAQDQVEALPEADNLESAS